MATELRYTEEARQWFQEGTKTIMVSLLMLLKLSCLVTMHVCHHPLVPLVACVIRHLYCQVGIEPVAPDLLLCVLHCLHFCGVLNGR